MDKRRELDEIIRRNFGESFGIKNKYLKPRKSTIGENFKRRLNHNVKYKNIRISGESTHIAYTINDIIDVTKGRTPQSEKQVPIEAVTRMDYEDLLKKGYKIKGMSDEEMNQIRNANDLGTITKRLTKWLGVWKFDDFVRADAKVILDDEGNVKMEYINQPHTMTEKLQGLHARNNEITNFFLNYTNIMMSIQVISPLGLIQWGLNKLLGRFGQLFDIWLGTHLGRFFHMRSLDKRYVDCATAISLAKQFKEVYEDLVEQANSKQSGNDAKKFSEASRYLANYISEEETELEKLRQELIKQRQSVKN